MGLRAGILAVQGDVEAHRRVLEALGAEVRCVRRASELDGLDALVLPGGESTTISKGLERRPTASDLTSKGILPPGVRERKTDCGLSASLLSTETIDRPRSDSYEPGPGVHTWKDPL